MKLVDEQLTLSPTDLSDFLACEHLTALELRGTARPERRRSAGRADPAQGDRARAGLPRVAARRGARRPRDRRRRRLGRRGRRDRAGAARRRRRRLPGAPSATGAGAGSPTSSSGRPTAPTRRSTRSSRGTRSRPTSSSSASTASSSRGSRDARPQRIHVVLGSGERESFRPEEFGAYYRRVRARLERFVADPPPTEPWPNDHCGVCDFKPVCDEHWDAVDHLSPRRRHPAHADREAARRRRSRRSPRSAAPRPSRRAGISPETYAKLRQQAELQLWGREHGRERYELLAAAARRRLRAPARALARRPLLRLRGQPVLGPDRRPRVPLGDPRRRPRASRRCTRTTATSERAALEQFVDLVHARLREYPDMHVYHYAQYEITALKRLMGRYGTREDEIDDLLRRGVFVDLLRVVRNGIRTSRPGYGLKELEAFLDFEPRGGGEGRRRVDRRSSSAGCRPATRRCSTRSTSTTARTASRRCCCATGCSGCSDEAVARFGPFPPVVPEEPKAAERAVGRAGRARSSGCFDAGEEVAAAPARLPPPRGQAGLVVVLRAARDDARRAARGRGVDRPASSPSASPSRSRSSRQAYTFTFPAQELKLARRAGRPRPGDRQARPASSSSSTASSGGSCSSAGRRSTTSTLPRALIPGGPFVTNVAGAARSSASAARCSRATAAIPALESILRREPFDRDVQTSDLERDEGARPLARRPPPRDPGPARLGQDVDVRAADRRPDRARQVGRRRLDEPQGDPQAPRGGRGRRGRARASTSRAARRRPPATRSRSTRASDRIENVTDSDACVGVDLDGRHGVALRARPRADARLPLHRRGRPGLARRRARDGHGGAERRPRRRPAAARAGDPGHAPGRHRGVGADVAARRRRDDPARPRPLPRAHVPAPPGRLRLHLGGVLRGAAAARPGDGGSGRRRSGPGCATSPVEHAGNRQESEEEVAAVRGARRASSSAAGIPLERGARGRAVQRAGERARGGAAAGRARRHGRQVPGAGGRRRRLLDDELERRRRPARPRVPALAEPAERGDVAGALPRVPGREPAAARGELPHDRRRCGSRTRCAASSSWPRGVSRLLRRADRVGEDAVLGRHELVLRAAGGFLHRDQVVEGGDSDEHAFDRHVVAGVSKLRVRRRTRRDR